MLTSREAEHSDEKRRIGQAATRFIHPGATVLVTGGTTTEAMVPSLAAIDNLTVVTNGLNIACKLTRYPQIAVVVLGVLLHQEMSLLGRIAEHVLSEFHVDVAVSSAYGIDPEAGLSGTNVTEAGTDRRMLQSATTLVVLADSSKVGRRGPVRLAACEQIDHLVTDVGAPPEALEAFRRKSIDVVAC